jgi:hypothetical protein
LQKKVKKNAHKSTNKIIKPQELIEEWVGARKRNKKKGRSPSLKRSCSFFDERKDGEEDNKDVQKDT